MSGTIEESDEIASRVITSFRLIQEGVIGYNTIVME